MGEIKSVLITGASGFIGRSTVACARAIGLRVVAVVRSNTPADWAEDDGISVIRCDLSEASCVQDLQAVMKVDAVIHAAAHMGGDIAKHEVDSVTATRHVLEAMPTDTRLVLVSSITVYDTMQIPAGTALTEDSPLEKAATAREPYTFAKLSQENLCRAAGHPCWIMRPGAVYGPGRSWHALMGFWVGPLHIQLNSGGDLPMTHVDHVAQALVSAAMTDPKGTSIVNVIDDDLPTRARFLKAHRSLTAWPKVVLPLPWGLWLGIAKCLSPVQNRLPGLLREPTLRARLMPLRYPNVALRQALGGQDIAPFEEMLARSVKGQQL